MTSLQIREHDIQRAIVDLLRYKGWYVLELSQITPVTKGVGAPDVIAWKKVISLTYCLLLEVKGAKGRLRKSQHDFMIDIYEYESTTLRYAVVRSVEDVERWLDRIFLNT